MSLGRSLTRLASEYKKHPWLHALSVLTIMISLIVVGGFLMIYKNLEHLAQHSQPEWVLTAYLTRDLNEGEKNRLIDGVMPIEGVAKTVFKNAEETKSEIADFLSSKEISNQFANDLFPSVFEVRFREGIEETATRKVESFLESQEFVSEIDISSDLVATFRSLKDSLRLGGIVLMLAILLGCGFLIANFMGMRHQSRKKEMDIIALMGAAPRFIYMPVLIEALFEGLVAAVLALLTLVVIKRVGLEVLAEQWQELFHVEQWLYLTPTQSILIVVFGLSMAAIGSLSVLSKLRQT